jgi:RimJ/RimL family protein N-acetyltransferase
MTADIMLREVADADLPIFFEQQRDPDANHMAAFTARDPSDWGAFLAHQRRNLADETNTTRTVLYDGQVSGSIACYQARPGELEVTYWLGKEYWGQGIATAALRAFLGMVTVRPIYGRAAKDNLGSLRVLQKCGFAIIGEGSGYANARGAEIEECLLRLD